MVVVVLLFLCLNESSGVHNITLVILYSPGSIVDFVVVVAVVVIVAIVNCCCWHCCCCCC